MSQISRKDTIPLVQGEGKASEGVAQLSSRRAKRSVLDDTAGESSDVGEKDGFAIAIFARGARIIAGPDCRPAISLHISLGSRAALLLVASHFIVDDIGPAKIGRPVGASPEFVL